MKTNVNADFMQVPEVTREMLESVFPYACDEEILRELISGPDCYICISADTSFGRRVRKTSVGIYAYGYETLEEAREFAAEVDEFNMKLMREKADYKLGEDIEILHLVNELTAPKKALETEKELEKAWLCVNSYGPLVEEQLAWYEYDSVETATEAARLLARSKSVVWVELDGIKDGVKYSRLYMKRS